MCDDDDDDDDDDDTSHLNIYLAGGRVRQFDLQELAKIILARGHVISSRWVWKDLAAECHEDRPALAVVNLEDVSGADVMIVDAFEPTKKGGRHFEAGYFHSLAEHGTRNRVLVVIGEPENIFHEMEVVRIAPTMADFINDFHNWEKRLLNLVNGYEEDYDEDE